MPFFIIGRENWLLRSALGPLVDGDDLQEAARRLSPLTLVGEAGSGKSHVANAITCRWRARLGAGAVRHFTAADFGREIQAAHAAGNLSTWRKSVRQASLLVIEDLHLLRPRDAIQQELRYAVEAVADRFDMALLTSQQEPSLLRTLDVGLCDRLAAGLTVRIGQPGCEARSKLLTVAARRRQIDAAPDRISELASRLNGPAAQVIAASAELAGVLAARSMGEQVSLKEIVAVTARYFGVTQSAVSGPGRRRSLVEARGQIVHLARCLTDLSFAEIGRGLGGRDHSTMMHAHRQTKQQLQDDPTTLAAQEALKRILQAT